MAGRIFYVDSKSGDDHNSGLSDERPWKSLEKVNSIVFGVDDKLLFRCGCSWQGTLMPKGDGIEKYPVRISSYGSGQKPEIDGCGAYAGVWLKGCSHYIVENLKVRNHACDKAVRQGICIEGKPEGVTEDITVRNCEILDVTGENGRDREIYNSMYWNGAVYVTVPGRSSRSDHLHHIHIINNYIHDVLTSGIRINQEEDFINDIHHTGIVVRGNRIERTGSDGIIVANSISPLIDGNVCYDAGALGTCEETRLIAGIWVCAVKDALIQRNEVARTRMFTGDGTAFDTDWGTEGTTIFQYNYSHDNEGGFWLDCSSLNYNKNYTKTVLRYNISLRDGRGIAIDDQGLLTEFYGNVFAYDKPFSVCVSGSGASFLFKNNEFYFKEVPDDNWGCSLFLHNYYAGQSHLKDAEAHLESRIDSAWLLENSKDGREWLENKWKQLCSLMKEH